MPLTSWLLGLMGVVPALGVLACALEGLLLRRARRTRRQRCRAAIVRFFAQCPIVHVKPGRTGDPSPRTTHTRHSRGRHALVAVPLDDMTLAHEEPPKDDNVVRLRGDGAQGAVLSPKALSRHGALESSPPSPGAGAAPRAFVRPLAAIPSAAFELARSDDELSPTPRGRPQIGAPSGRLVSSHI